MKPTNKPYFFVLGAPDHEMQEIARVCKEQGIAFGFATLDGSTVHAHEAYDAHGVLALLPIDAHVVFVECRVLGLRCDDVIDHHNPGDPGFGKTPSEFYQGSSLGQFLSMVGLKPTQRQRVIAACDHCLSAAYQGRCPGVSPEEVQSFREETRSRARGLSVSELREQIEQAAQRLKNAPKIPVDGVEVPWLEGPELVEASEASARLGLPYMYARKQEDGRIKSGIRSAPSRLVEYWMTHCGLKQVYGDPQRGFAGGYC